MTQPQPPSSPSPSLLPALPLPSPFLSPLVLNYHFRQHHHHHHNHYHSPYHSQKDVTSLFTAGLNCSLFMHQGERHYVAHNHATDLYLSDFNTSTPPLAKTRATINLPCPINIKFKTNIISNRRPRPFMKPNCTDLQIKTVTLIAD